MIVGETLRSQTSRQSFHTSSFVSFTFATMGGNQTGAQKRRKRQERVENAKERREVVAAVVAVVGRSKATLPDQIAPE